MGYATHINNIFFFSSDDIPTTTFFNHIQFDTVDRGAIICPAAFQDGDGVYKCQKHGSHSMYDPVSMQLSLEAFRPSLAEFLYPFVSFYDWFDLLFLGCTVCFAWKKQIHKQRMAVKKHWLNVFGIHEECNIKPALNESGRIWWGTYSSLAITLVYMDLIPSCVSPVLEIVGYWNSRRSWSIRITTTEGKLLNSFMYQSHHNFIV